MAVKGTEAKKIVEDTIAKAFGEKFLGIVDKKIYLEIQENGEPVQVALTMTCPKAAIDFGERKTSASVEEKVVNTEFTKEETQTIENILAKLDF